MNTAYTDLENILDKDQEKFITNVAIYYANTHSSCITDEHRFYKNVHMDCLYSYVEILLEQYMNDKNVNIGHLNANNLELMIKNWIEKNLDKINIEVLFLMLCELRKDIDNK